MGAAGQAGWVWLSGGHRALLTVTLTSEAGQLGVTLSNPISGAWLLPQREMQGGGDCGPWLLAASKAPFAKLHHRLPSLLACAGPTSITSATTYLTPFIIGPLEK